MRRSMFLLVAVLLFPACASRSYIRSAIGEVAPAQINLAPWEYVRSTRQLTLQWARLGPPLWVRRADDGGLEAIGVIVERGGSGVGGYAWTEFGGPALVVPGRTHLVAVSYAPNGSIRRPTERLRRDMDEMVRDLRRRAW